MIPFLIRIEAKDLSIEISRKLVELAAAGVTDPAQLRRLALEKACRYPRHTSQRLGQGIVGPLGIAKRAKAKSHVRLWRPGSHCSFDAPGRGVMPTTA